MSSITNRKCDCLYLMMLKFLGAPECTLRARKMVAVGRKE